MYFIHACTRMYTHALTHIHARVNAHTRILKKMTTRARRVSAPGAPRLTLTGVMAVPDKFGRVRILLLNEHPNGSPNKSFTILDTALEGVVDLPFTRNTPKSIKADGVVGVCWAVSPAHRKAHWLGVAEQLRGQWVRIEVTVRKYCVFAPEQAQAQVEPAQAALAQFERDQERVPGASLDICMIEALLPGTV